ncbi:MAG: WYL domain-containing protein [Ruminococcaceae bacterium]|nr:WYL domain-containing protein [Oscillospiraceae bacterium]
MAKRGKQKLKLLRIRDALLEYSDETHPMTVADIIGYLETCGIEAERKSIYEDIEELKYYGMDIITVKGKGGGYYVGSRDFETAELKLLVDAVQSSKFITTAKSRQLIDSISSLAGVHDRAKLKRQIYISDRIKSMNKSIYYTVDSIHTAINENSKIRFGYYHLNSKKEKIRHHDGKIYEASPWLLTWNDEYYYLAAYDSKSGIMKHYRVDKMERVTVTGERRDGEEVFKKMDLDLYSTGMFGMFTGELENVTLECDESLAGAVLDRFGMDTFTSQRENGKFIASVKVAVSPLFFGWVAGFGTKMKITAPERVANEMKNNLSDILKLYES